MVTASCLLPTYNMFRHGRHADGTVLVAEAVECFLRQTFTDAELILCNDCPAQQYVWDHPDERVFVWNVPRRFTSLGEKLNAMAAIARGQYLFRWDGDDLYFPHRLEAQLERFHSQHADYVNSNGSWWCDSGKYKYSRSGHFAAVACSRRLFNDLGGFPHLGNGEDLAFEKLAKDSQWKVDFAPVTPRTAWACFRWGTGTEHVSGYGDGGYEIMGKQPTVEGVRYLKPFLRRDYFDDIRHHETYLADQ